METTAEKKLEAVFQMRTEAVEPIPPQTLLLGKNNVFKYVIGNHSNKWAASSEKKKKKKRLVFSV